MSDQSPERSGNGDPDIMSDSDLDALLAQASMLASDLSSEVGPEEASDPDTAGPVAAGPVAAGPVAAGPPTGHSGDIDPQSAESDDIDAADAGAQETGDEISDQAGGPAGEHASAENGFAPADGDGDAEADTIDALDSSLAELETVTASVTTEIGEAEPEGRVSSLGADNGDGCTTIIEEIDEAHSDDETGATPEGTGADLTIPDFMMDLTGPADGGDSDSFMGSVPPPSPEALAAAANDIQRTAESSQLDFDDDDDALSPTETSIKPTEKAAIEYEDEVVAPSRLGMMLTRFAPLGMKVGGVLAVVLELLDKPFGMVGERVRTLLGWLAIATLATSLVVLAISFL